MTQDSRKIRLAAWLSTKIIDFLAATVRVRHVHSERMTDVRQTIVGIWHSHLILSTHTPYPRPMMVMVSQSRDGELLSQVFAHYGVATSRGSSTRGGSKALREMMRAARGGTSLCLVPDGPKGPPRVAQEGIVWAAQATGLPITMMAFAADKKKHLRSWDRLVVPLPFSRAIFLYGGPMHVPRDGDIEEWRKKIEDALNALAMEAEMNLNELWKQGETLKKIRNRLTNSRQLSTVNREPENR